MTSLPNLAPSPLVLPGLLLFLQGIAVGFAVAAPVGPVGLLTIRQSLHHGRITGFVTGLGAATADAIFGFIAALGFTAVITFFTRHEPTLQLVGGLVMIVLGLHAARTKPPSGPGLAEPPHLWTAYASTVAITLTNPMTILGFIALYSGLKLHPTGFVHVIDLTTGVFLGSTLWWLLLSAFAGWLGTKFNSVALHRINLVVGLAIAALGAWQLARLWR